MDSKSTVDAAKNWLQSFNLEQWFGESSDAIQVALCFVSFFAIGFLLKKYLRFILMCLIVSFLIIKGLEHYAVLDIDWEALNTLLGFEPTSTLSTVANKFVIWVKSNVVITISSTLGFLVGYKLG